MSYAVNDNSSVYYEHTYWNDLEAVRDEINRRVSGDPQRYWFHRFSDLVGGRVFKRALILNCGNGNVERGLFDNGLIEECVGVDYSEELLAQARRDNADHAARYVQMDSNTADFPDESFDLVVNFAAGHHIAKIDKVFRRFAEMLGDDGWFVSYDYIGPHRNQYGYDLWNAAHQLNETLPTTVRQDMRYPHLPTMLATDPTEAIHSELIRETFLRYFNEAEYRPAGGGLAYLLLTHNASIFAADPSERDAAVAKILAADAAHLATHPDQVLFAYFAGQPNRSVLEQSAELARWTAEEDAREDRALVAGGEYYPHTALQHLELRLEQQRALADQAHELELVRAEVEMLRRTFPFPQWVRAKAAVGKVVRRSPAVDRAARSVLARARARAA